ncbi:hypothetical protein AWC17_13280 [Mycobacterium nebraskense]|uniref:DUF2637 domain-containing protein n=2 Tax=Mycobacterium nebraskense TaxID=244292 RepID=A0A1X1Z1J7_9MYCO|nr:hypothetical protein AWC17_13280 [Mycobacterium nebraskense]
MRAKRFFWAVLLCATAVSIGGNAAHAMLKTMGVPSALGAAVATVPPLVLLASTEGVAMLVRARRGSSAAYWCALSMTGLLAVCAFVLSFNALQDLAARAGIDHRLAWLWPIAVDASIAQCTVALLSLSRQQSTAPVSSATVAMRAAIAAEVAEESTSAAGAVESADPNGAAVAAVPEAAALVEEGVTKQPPEVVAEVLARHRSGQKAGHIATQMNLHHSTVNRLLNASHKRRQPGISTTGRIAAGTAAPEQPRDAVQVA